MKASVYNWKTNCYKLRKAVERGMAEGFKVIHSGKNLFCYVALICNLVQEFNGLVSKGPAI